MILRVVSGSIPAGRLDAVVDSYRKAYVPIARETPGLDLFVVAARPSDDDAHDMAAMTIWTTVEAALEAYAGDLTAVRTLDDRSHGETLSRVDYYEIDEGGARRRSGPSTRLRLTAGKVARGHDADIQQELRRRLPELPLEVIGAWVGRRVLAADVEIALVSTWSTVPAGMALDAPIWPTISDRYDTFLVMVYDILVEGIGAG